LNSKLKRTKFEFLNKSLKFLPGIQPKWLIDESELNGSGSTINRALDGSTYPS
jgi:hypothetical protein